MVLYFTLKSLFYNLNKSFFTLFIINIIQHLVQVIELDFSPFVSILPLLDVSELLCRIHVYASRWRQLTVFVDEYGCRRSVTVLNYCPGHTDECHCP